MFHVFNQYDKLIHQAYKSQDKTPEIQHWGILNIRKGFPFQSISKRNNGRVLVWPSFKLHTSLSHWDFHVLFNSEGKKQQKAQHVVKTLQKLS